MYHSDVGTQPEQSSTQRDRGKLAMSRRFAVKGYKLSKLDKYPLSEGYFVKTLSYSPVTHNTFKEVFGIYIILGLRPVTPF